MIPEFRQSIAREAEKMTGQPGTPISSEEDRRERNAWRRERVLSTQRARGARLHRIDYANVAPEAAAIIDSLYAPHVGGDVSAILSRIVIEWAARKWNKARVLMRGLLRPGPFLSRRANHEAIPSVPADRDPLEAEERAALDPHPE